MQNGINFSSNCGTRNSDVSANGSGWDSLLDAIASMRQQDNAPDDVYYYGIFAPASTMGNYCGFGCVSGLGMIGGPGDSYSRAAIGLGIVDAHLAREQEDSVRADIAASLDSRG